MKLFFYPLIFVSLSLCAFVVKAQWHEFRSTAMTTPIEMAFWSTDAEKAEIISKQVFKEFERLESKLSSYIPSSELSALNAQAYKGFVPVSNELYWLLDQSLEVSRLSAGAFDISFASLGFKYNYRERFKPSSKELERLLPAIDYESIQLDDENTAVKFLKEALKIDLGGIAKGYAVDRGISVLKRNGIKQGRLSAGGDMFLLGDKQGKPWIVGIKHPRAPDKNFAVLPLSGEAISTSGDYERFFIDENGERVHHIISPKSGRSAKEVLSVSVIGDNATMTDALSTAVFVLGVSEGLKMIDSIIGYESIIIDSSLRAHFSKGLSR